MGEIVGAGVVSHVPTIMLPQSIRFELNEGREISLVPGLRRLRTEVLDRLQADTIVVLDTHWATTVEFVVSSHTNRSGLYTSEELPRGMSQIPYDFAGDPQLAELLVAAAKDRDDMWITPIDDPHLPIHYPTVNLLTYLQRPGHRDEREQERWMGIGMCQTGEPADFLLVGRLLAEAIATSDRRVVILASGGMSHSFWPLQQLRKHESSDPSHVRTPEARMADERILERWSLGDHASVLHGMPEYAQFKPEGRFGHYLTMVGALGGADCVARGVQFSDYENSVGTGQVHVWFDRPEAGWVRT